MRLTDIPLDRPVATLMLLLSLTVLGTVAVFLLPLDFMPVVKEPEIDIEIPFPGATRSRPCARSSNPSKRRSPPSPT